MAYGYPNRSGGIRLLLFILCLFFGLYFINIPFNFVAMPTFSTSITNIIMLVGGILLILAGIGNLFRRRF